MYRFNSISTLIQACYILITIILIPGQAMADGTIADHTVSKESVLRSIPESAIEAARTNLHIAYFHSSHGSRVITGMEGLTQYKTGDDTLFAFSENGIPLAGYLDIDDHYSSGNDLSSKEVVQSNGYTQWFNETVTFLDDPDNADINVVMWSWCDPAGHDHAKYIADMEELITRYGENGSKIGTSGDKTKEIPVTFVFMTGHPNGDGESSSTTSAYHCHTLVKQHCLANNRFLLDYWDIETHGMDDTYYPYADDNGVENSVEFYLDWQDQNPDNYFANDCAHCSTDQDLTCNRKAYAAWWLWSRLAGWDDGSDNDSDSGTGGDTDANETDGSDDDSSCFISATNSTC